MNYKPTTWTNGDKITADKLNNIELGLVKAQEDESPILIKFTPTIQNNEVLNFKTDTTYSEFKNLYKNGKTIYFDFSYNGNLCLSIPYLNEENSIYPFFCILPSSINNSYSCQVLENGRMYIPISILL